MNRKGFISNLYIVLSALILIAVALLIFYFIRSDVGVGRNIIITRLLEM